MGFNSGFKGLINVLFRDKSKANHMPKHQEVKAYRGCGWQHPHVSNFITSSRRNCSKMPKNFI